MGEVLEFDSLRAFGLVTTHIHDPPQSIDAFARVDCAREN